MMSNGDWIGPLSLTVAVMCFDENKELSFENKRQELLDADLSAFNRCSEALAHILKLLQAANTAYGSSFMTNYDLFNLIKQKMDAQVRYEVDEITATRKSLDLRKLEWQDIEEMISDAWGTASRRPKTYYDRIIPIDQPHKPATSKDNVPFTAHPGHLAAVTDGAFKDKTLKCARITDTGAICNDEFTWSSQAQQLHKRLGYSSVPKFCPLHQCLRGTQKVDFFRRLLGQSCGTTSCALLGGHSDFLASAKVRVPVPDRRIPGSSPADGSFWGNRKKKSTLQR